MRAAMMATVPSAALFGFAGTSASPPVQAQVLMAPVEPAGTAEPLLERGPEATPSAVEASYYGPGLTGKPTANGERFDPEQLTAAHRTLPFGSIVKVTNAATGKSVEVKINDRGPFHGNREIDLSVAAAREIGMLASGTGKVMLQVVDRA